MFQKLFLILFAFMATFSSTNVTASLINRCSSTNALSDFTAIDLDNMDWYEVARSPSTTNNCTRFYVLVEETDFATQRSLIRLNKYFNFLFKVLVN